MLDEDAVMQELGQQPQRDDDHDEGSDYYRIFDGGLAHLIAHHAHAQGIYSPCIPLEIASQSSSIFGLNTVIARIAMTTRTPTRIAYSVVP